MGKLPVCISLVIVVAMAAGISFADEDDMVKRHEKWVGKVQLAHVKKLDKAVNDTRAAGGHAVAATAADERSDVHVGGIIVTYVVMEPVPSPDMARAILEGLLMAAKQGMTMPGDVVMTTYGIDGRDIVCDYGQIGMSQVSLPSVPLKSIDMAAIRQKLADVVARDGAADGTGAAALTLINGTLQRTDNIDTGIRPGLPAIDPDLQARMNITDGASCSVSRTATYTMVSTMAPAAHQIFSKAGK